MTRSRQYLRACSVIGEKKPVAKMLRGRYYRRREENEGGSRKETRVNFQQTQKIDV